MTSLPPLTSVPACVPSYQAEWDAGDMGCGELVMALMMRMRKLESGQVMRLGACDPGAIEDIPAWCKMTGHALLHTVHEVDNHFFFIQRK